MQAKQKIKIFNIYNMIFLIIALVLLSVILGIIKIKNDKEKSYFEENKHLLTIAYKSTIAKYNYFTAHLYSNEIMNQNNLLLFYKASHAKDEKERRYYKGMLFRALYPTYEKIKKEGIRQLHFHLPNNESFLRFHKPSKFGDNLSFSRPSVKFVNEHKKSISLFETGRVVSGFRNIFPVTYKNEHLGSVEISVSLKAMLNSLNSLYKDKDFTFIFYKKLINSKLFKEQKHLYSDSAISHSFVQEDSTSILSDSPKPLNDLQAKINKQLLKDSKLQKTLENGKTYSTLVNISNQYYEVSFLPMKGVHNNIEGYLVSYGEAKNISLVERHFKYLLIFVIVVFTLILLAIQIIKRKSKALEEEKAWFSRISDSLGDGLYVMNNDSLIEYINPKACDILGYSKEELLGKSAHHIFHAHKSNKKIPLKDCPILKAVKEFGYIETISEYFLKKDGTKIPVEINSRNTLKDEKEQVVTIFKDITVKKALEDKMRLLTKALESSANTVMITDKLAKIEWVNKAFEKLTGYHSVEAIGKTPAQLTKSEKHSNNFYKNMWQTILSKQAWKSEIINKRKDGSLYYEEMSITPVLDNNQEIQNFIAIKQDISARKEREKSIEHFAHYDSLTNLPNRRLFINHMALTLKTLTREQKSLAILFLDLDKFKILNDTQGHDAGDEVLQKVSKRITKVLREQDIVARLGGDEFIILLDDLPYQYVQSQVNCEVISNKILKSLKEPYKLKKCIYNLSASIGVYILNNSNESIDDIIKKADIALYQAKAKGRNTFSIYSE